MDDNTDSEGVRSSNEAKRSNQTSRVSISFFTILYPPCAFFPLLLNNQIVPFMLCAWFFYRDQVSNVTPPPSSTFFLYLYVLRKMNTQAPVMAPAALQERQCQWIWKDVQYVPPINNCCYFCFCFFMPLHMALGDLSSKFITRFISETLAVKFFMC